MERASQKQGKAVYRSDNGGKVFMSEGQEVEVQEQQDDMPKLKMDAFD